MATSRRLLASLGALVLLSASNAQAQAIRTNTVLSTVTIVGVADVSYSWMFIWTGSSFPPAKVYVQMQLSKKMQEALKLADVCKAALSESGRRVTGGSDITSRWLASQEVFNSLAMANMINSYLSATSGLEFMMDGVSYQGFQVTYRDGSTERWAINPGWRTSSIKLVDTPMPNSLKQPTQKRESC